MNAIHVPSKIGLPREIAISNASCKVQLGIAIRHWYNLNQLIGRDTQAISFLRYADATVFLIHINATYSIELFTFSNDTAPEID